MFAEKLKELRKANKLTQYALAKELGVSTSAIGLWETQKREPDYETMLKISQLFNVTVDYLIGTKNENQIIIIGRNGDFKSFNLKEKDLITLEKLAESLTENNLD